MKFYFTFGYGHADANNEKLDDCYTIVEAADYGEARDKMIKTWGTVWAFQYDQDQWNEAGKKPYAIKLTYVPFPPSKFREERSLKDLYNTDESIEREQQTTNEETK